MGESTQPRRIIERLWRISREITEVEFAFDMEKAKIMDLRIHSWEGKDVQGQPLTVTWVAAAQTGRLFSAYEITGGE